MPATKKCLSEGRTKKKKNYRGSFRLIAAGSARAVWFLLAGRSFRCGEFSPPPPPPPPHLPRTLPPSDNSSAPEAQSVLSKFTDGPRRRRRFQVLAKSPLLLQAQKKKKSTPSDPSNKMHLIRSANSRLVKSVFFPALDFLYFHGGS